jgi:hypothetical protein
MDGRWSVRRGMREVVRPLKGHSVRIRMRQQHCRHDGVSGDGDEEGAWW